MTITGHESAQVFRRCAGIIDPKEQEAAFAAREALFRVSAPGEATRAEKGYDTSKLQRVPQRW